MTRIRYPLPHTQRRAARFQASAASVHLGRHNRRSLTVLIAAVALVGGLAALIWFEQSSTWRIQRVQVRGNAAIPVEAILSASALSGAHFYHTDLDAAAQRIRSLPGVKGARITCRWEWAASCIIDVQPAAVAVVWEYRGNTLWSDYQGYLQNAAGDLSAPVRVRVVEGELPLQQGRLPEPLLRAVSELAVMQPHVRQYEYSARHGLIWMMDDRQMVRLGDAPHEGDMREKVKLARELQLALELRGIRPSVIDVRYPHAPYYVR